MISIDSESEAGKRVNRGFTLPQRQRADRALMKSDLGSWRGFRYGLYLNHLSDRDRQQRGGTPWLFA
jgi:hypothetical protein